RLVGLGMRPQVHLVRLGEGRHLRNVAVEHLQVEHQRRRVQRAPRSLLADQMAVEFLGFTHDLSLRLRTTMASPVVPRFTPALFMNMFSLPVPQSAMPCAKRPPSTLTVSPVMKRASSEHRNEATSAMTSGSPRSGHGWCWNCRSYFSGRPRWTSGVEITPGAMPTTRMRSGPSSAATFSIRLMTAALADE